MTQYDVETFKRIEGLIGVRLEAYPLEESDVMALLPQVETAEKLASDQLREQEQEEKDKKKKKNKKSKQKGANFANATDGGGDTERGSYMSVLKKAKVEKKKL